VIGTSFLTGFADAGRMPNTKHSRIAKKWDGEARRWDQREW
jgi:hypothetical protein